MLILILIPSLAAGATLHGSIYNSELELEEGVVASINTTPEQRLIASDGRYSFEVPLGNYLLTAQKGEIITREEVQVRQEGNFVFDLILIPDFEDEEELWEDTEADPLPPERKFPWQYLAAAAIVAFALYRYLKLRRKLGSLWKFRRRVREEAAKSIEQHKAELEKEPGHAEKALEILQKHDGRITQKELRKEMLYLSEAKISLIITELEHKGKIEKVKKGRGNVILMK